MFEMQYVGEVTGSEIITQVAERDGYRIIVTQEFLQPCRGGFYFYAVFDSAGNLRAISTRDCVFQPMAARANDPEPDGRITPQAAESLLELILPKLQQIDAASSNDGGLLTDAEHVEIFNA